MPEREKLIELIGRTPCCGFSSRAAAEHIADHLIASGVTVQQWIPVTERLPEVGQRVIVSRPGKVEQGVWLGTNGWWKVYGANTKAVTHWMPLPEPPKEEPI